ncbi:hypothetical protein TNIN_271551 [Trichonephila inaurata madagascariensis]|uniref:Uncharacterized protein n=1 Tax=Trichonephila inaurata madagascariensis TaxID=2747483 RepID=A0A8X6J9B8_9ARAC|nr:hypothetical protein TNIN_271551 [Trichonephila inaurata madagascariensis]
MSRIMKEPFDETGSPLKWILAVTRKCYSQPLIILSPYYTHTLLKVESLASRGLFRSLSSKKELSHRYLHLSRKDREGMAWNKNTSGLTLSFLVEFPGVDASRGSGRLFLQLRDK